MALIETGVIYINSDWVKRDLPCHKQRGKVFFLYSEVLDYIRKSNKKRYPELV